MKRSVWIGLAALAALSVGCDDDSAAEPTEGTDDMGVVPREGCMTDLSCGDGMVCVANECRIGQCNLDRTCPAGQTCQRDTYTCSGGGPAGCVNDNDCNAGFCVRGACENVQCVRDEHCNPNETCNDQNRCVGGVAECVDGDMDGYGLGCDRGPDCDDSREMVNPGATENGEVNCGDGIDHDCQGGDTECGEMDADMDGVSDKAGDCDDNDPDVNPTMMEVPYNGKDDDCDPATRDDDVDGDGFPTDCDRYCPMTADPVGCAENCEVDCDDRARTISPAARDIPGDGIDQDCDGMDRVPDDGDADNDGVSEADGDCDDNNPDVNPNAEEVPYNGRDDDCDHLTRDNDLDEDGFSTPQDCADDNADVNPNAREIYYNGVDDDCDPETADGDQDGDGHDAEAAGGDDCNDEAAGINPDAEEAPYNGDDDDCDPATPDDDIDDDGFPRETDCDDMNADVNPDAVENAETNCSDDIDHNCVGGDVVCDEGALDSDNDGVPDDQDCEPMNADVPGPEEIPGNGVDDDCNPETPDEVVDCDNDAFDEANPNDDSESATGVEDGNNRIGVQYSNLVLCPDESDWYRIDLQAGDGLEVDFWFMHAEGDIDVRLFKQIDGELVRVDTSVSVSDSETVYERRASADATYFVQVFRFRSATNDYGMTVNVFTQCADDLESPTGEHNDTREEASDFPPIGETRVACDYDDDWYEFFVAEAGNVRIDLLFTHADGDLDMILYHEDEPNALDRAVGVVDNETIEMDLQPGRHLLRVYGSGRATNSYTLFRTSGEADSIRQSVSDDVDLPDRGAAGPSVTDIEIAFNAPAGAVISQLTVRDLDINHTWLNDLVVKYLWEGEEIVTVWNRDGDADGDDNGLDDDFLPFTGSDINFDNRRYLQFAGLPARGTFTLRIEDHGPRDTGEFDNLDVEIDFLVP